MPRVAQSLPICAMQHPIARHHGSSVARTAAVTNRPGKKLPGRIPVSSVFWLFGGERDGAHRDDATAAAGRRAAVEQ